jgi:hypothetical protein
VIRMLAGLVVYLVLIALAFAMIFAFGWAVVHLVGRPLLHLLPTPIAVLATAAVTAGAVYGGLNLLGRRRRLHVKPTS